jgi:hypothetical protein
MTEIAKRVRRALIAGLWGISLFGSTTRAALEPAALREHVEHLASDGLRGRDTGEPGIRKAEAYVARAFRAAGLEPLPGRSSHFVGVELYRSGYDPRTTVLELKLGGAARTVRGRAGSDFRPFPFSDDGRVSAQVVFAGYGISAPEADWDDYAGLDVEGKLVLVLRHGPGEADAAGPFSGGASTHTTFQTKAERAAEHGAVGMLLVTDPLNHSGGDDLRLHGGKLSLEPPRATATEEGDEPGAPKPFLAAHVSREIAEALAETGGYALEPLQRAIDAGTPPRELPLGEVVATLEVHTAAEVERVPARNVAGFLEGRDERLKHEWIVVGGHHDHVGAFDGPGDTVFNGADDNASGTAGVIELAEWFASRAERPRRSLVFVTFTAEERGLLGSRALVEQRVLSPDQVVFMLNLDMIGRNPERPVDVFGDGYVRGLREVVEAANAGVDLELHFGDAAYVATSDHDAFYSADVPFMFFFTGVHEDYHQVGDHAAKVDYARMGRIVRVAAGVIERLAEAPQAPQFIHHVGWLGVQVELVGDPSRPVATVTAVDADSRAARAGLLDGDEIASFDGVPLESAERVGQRFRDVAPGGQLRLGVLRDGVGMELDVQRAKTGYLGVTPAPLDEDVRRRAGLAEGEGLMLREVVAGGPAAAAGLRSGDVVTHIGGRTVDLASLRSHLVRLGAGETVGVTVWREGEPIVVRVTLGERP